jgi:sugar/nucleoside kinase (ribokinase family)
MMATVTCVGLAVQDYVFDIGPPIIPGHKNFARSFTPVGGGPAANAAVTVAKLGGASRLVTQLGTDTVGDSIVRDLALCNVDVSRIRRIPGIPSPVSAVLVDEMGERTIVNHTPEAFLKTTDAITGVDLAGTHVVLTDLRWPAGARSAISGAQTLGIPSVVDFDLTNGEPSNDIVETATHVIFSEPALLRFAGQSDIDGALRTVGTATDAFVGVTLGSEGFRWMDHDVVRTFPGYDVEVINTLGAGDVFHGTFALGIAEGLTIVDIVQWSSAAAALKCMGKGTRDDIPTRSATETFLKKYQETQ